MFEESPLERNEILTDKAGSFMEDKCDKDLVQLFPAFFFPDAEVTAVAPGWKKRVSGAFMVAEACGLKFRISYLGIGQYTLYARGEARNRVCISWFNSLLTDLGHICGVCGRDTGSSLASEGCPPLCEECRKRFGVWTGSMLEEDHEEEDGTDEGHLDPFDFDDSIYEGLTPWDADGNDKD